MIQLSRTCSALLAAILLLALASGCAPKQPVALHFDSAEVAWQVFQDHYCRPIDGPGLKVKASLHYTREKPDRRSNRTGVTIWGDFGGPVRLNVSAALGKIVAMIREDTDGLLIFYPTEDKAYAHANPVLGATSLGMPFPFSLNELSKVAMGDFSGLTGKAYAKVTIKDSSYVFTLEDGLATTITLDGNGRPIIIEGSARTAYDSNRQWQLALENFDKKPTPQPAKLVLTMNNGEKGVLRIKSREIRMERWSDKATTLTLPDETQFYWLDGRAEPAG